MLTISRFGRMFNLSRTSLLYYDAIGLLKPAGKNNSGYRLYNDKDAEKLEKIILYRNTGLPLLEIKKLLDKEDGFDISAVLVKKLGELNREIEKIKCMQGIIIEILKDKDILKNIFRNDFESFKKLAGSIGINGENALKWHEDFEKNSPEVHEKFLKALGFSKDEIKVFIDNIFKNT